MTARIRAKHIVAALAVVGFTPSAWAGRSTVSADDLARCAAITAADTRLACYDALAASVHAAAGATAEPDAPVQPAARATAEPDVPGQPAVAPPATVATASARRDTPAVSTNAALAPPQTAGDAEKDFGLGKRQLPAVAEGPSSIKAVVSQMTEDRLNNVYLVLDNGQTWSFMEPDPRIRPGDSVTIRRASLGSYLLTTPSRRSYRVRRVQ